MKATAIAALIATSLAASMAIAADPPKPRIEPDSPVSADNVMGQSPATEGAKARTETLTRSEKREARKAKNAKGSRETKGGFVSRHFEPGGDVPNASPAVTETKKSVSGNPGSQ